MWTVWIALLLWASPTQGVTTHCVIPAVERFQNTALTCKFSDDISRLKQDFKVQFYKSNTTDSTEVILDCFWGNDKPECTVHKCCEYDYHVNETLTLRVLNVTETRVGRYVCFVLPAAPDSYNFCNFTLTEKQHTDTAGSNLAALAALIVIPVVICILLLIVWRGKRRQKAGRQNTGKETNHFCPVQLCLAKKKPGDEETKRPLNESQDEANDGNQPTNVSDSKDRNTGKDLHSTDLKTAEKSDNIDGSQRPGHTSLIQRILTWIGTPFQREPVNRNADLSCKHQQEPLIMKNEPHVTSVTEPEMKREEIEKVQRVVDKTFVSEGTSKINPDVSKSVLNEMVPQPQQTQSPSKGSDSTPHKSLSEQNDVITPIAVQSSDDVTRTRSETSQTLGGKELQTVKETKDQKTDEYKDATTITKEGGKAKNARKGAMKKEKEAQKKAENYRQVAQDKAQKETQNAKEKAEKEEKLVKEKAELDETIAKDKAEKLEKIAKEKAEREERMANDKAKEEEKIAKDNAEKEEKIAKRTSKTMTNTSATIEEQLKKISNEKEEQMKKISKRKEEQMELITKEKDERLEKIGKEKREELEKIAIMREKQLQDISKRKAEEIEEIRNRTEDEMEKIANMKDIHLKEISRKKEEKMDKIRKENEKRMKSKIKKKDKKMESIKKEEEDQSKKNGKGKDQTAVLQSVEVQNQDKQSRLEETACKVERAEETVPFLATQNSNFQVNAATSSQSTTDTIIQMSELASQQDTSETPSRKQDIVGNPVKEKNNEDIESNGKASKKSGCVVS